VTDWRRGAPKTAAPRDQHVPTLPGVPVITIDFPTPEEEELTRRFTVNRNYLQALAGFLTTT
jgi:hypothetical protein